MASGDYNELDLLEILRVLRKSFWTIAALFAAAVTAAALATVFIVPKKYQCTFVFRIQSRGVPNRIDSMGALTATQLGELGGLLPQTDGNALANLVKETITARGFQGKVLRRCGYPSSPEDAERFAKRISVEIRNPDIIRVGVIWTDPRRTYDLAQAILELCRLELEARIKRQATWNKGFIEEHFRRTRDQLARADDNLARFCRAHGLPLPPPGPAADFQWPAALGLSDAGEYQRLLRERRVAEEIYFLLVGQLEQARLAESREDNMEIEAIDPPVVPYKKHSPSLGLNVAVAGFLALFLGMGIAFFREYLAKHTGAGTRAEPV
ncbi:MAG: Wzz/FepE/Etk N-terminal domain-containing protein [Bacteroidota bacterium]